jgi:hypothetical protein
MRTIGTHATRGKSHKRNGDRPLPGVRETVNGAPLELIDLMTRPIPRLPDVSRGGAVSGAAQVMTMGSSLDDGEERAVALSDGSSISFASIAALGLFKGD